MAIRPRHGEGMVLIDDVACSGCGCRDIRVSSGQKFCRHCGKRWLRRVAVASEPEPELPDNVVRYHVTRCPKCRSEKTKITSTRKPYRHHKCKSCEHCFKSLEG